MGSAPATPLSRTTLHVRATSHNSHAVRACVS